MGAFIAKEMKAQRLLPRDFVILVRQKAGDYVPLLADALADHEIVLRNEAAEIESWLQEISAAEKQRR